MDVAFKTLGCKLNYSETSSISRDFENKGYNKVSFEDVADIYVINTCSVTHNADKEFKYLVNKVKRINPNSKVVAIGCYAQLKPKEISSFKGVDLVLGADKKFKIIDYLDSSSHHSCEINSVNYFKSSYSLGDRTRSFLKVLDGCDYKCTYCTIPLARGKSRSGNINEIIENAKTLVGNGIKEVVLTGVNIGDYGILENKGRQTNFLTLLKEIEKIKNLERVRISSIEPNLLNNEIIEFLKYNMRSQMFAKSLQMQLVIGALKRLELIRTRPEFKQKLWENVNLLQSGLKERGFDIGSTQSCVTPVYLKGSIPEAMALVKDLRENYHIFCSIVVYPVIPKGLILLRLIPTASHNNNDINETLDAFSSIRKKLEKGVYKQASKGIEESVD